MFLPGYSCSLREKVGEGVYMEQENILANAEPTEKKTKPKPLGAGEQSV